MKKNEFWEKAFGKDKDEKPCPCMKETLPVKPQLEEK